MKVWSTIAVEVAAKLKLDQLAYRREYLARALQEHLKECVRMRPGPDLVSPPSLRRVALDWMRDGSIRHLEVSCRVIALR